MTLQFKKSSHRIAFMLSLIVVILLLTKGLKFSGWSLIPKLATLRYDALFLMPIFTFFIYKKVANRGVVHNKGLFLYFIFTCFFTFLLRNLFYDTGLAYGLENNIFIAFVFCSYFIIHYLKVPEDVLIKSLTVVGLLVLLIQVYQNIYPDNALFSMYTEDMREEMGLSADYVAGMRNGLYRFKPISQHLPLLLFCYYLSKMLCGYKHLYLILTCAFAASVYLTLTRMFMVSVGLCFVFMYLFLNRKRKSKVGLRLILILGFILLFFYGDTLFSSLFSSKDSDIEYSGQARLGCYSFLFEQAISNPILFITGHGYPALLWQWGGNLGYWYNDIGIFGQVYPYGIIWLFVYFRIVYWLLIKQRHKIPIYIRSYIFGLFCICMMMTTYATLDTVLLFCIIMYISDLYISKSDRTENNVI